MAALFWVVGTQIILARGNLHRHSDILRNISSFIENDLTEITVTLYSHPEYPLSLAYTKLLLQDF